MAVLRDDIMVCTRKPLRQEQNRQLDLDLDDLESHLSPRVTLF